MSKPKVAVVRYESPQSVARAIDLGQALANLPRQARVFVKPNLVFWSREADFPRWGVLTTTTVAAQVVAALKDLGAREILLGEGMVLMDPKDEATPADAFVRLGYQELARRHGVKLVNTLTRPHRKVDLGGDTSLNFSEDALESDFLVNLPVLKTHAQTVVSLGLKNLKGLIDVPSRKKCHSPDPIHDLDFFIARFLKAIPPSATLIDGIYSLERGPGFDGQARRSNVLVASADPLAADLAGAKLLGHEPQDVPHLRLAAAERGVPPDLSWLETVGEPVESLARRHEHAFLYDEKGELPLALVKMGLQGLSYRRYDSTICTYCSILNGHVITAIIQAWKGQPFDEVEILTGKLMKPRPGKKKTILLGKCMYQANKDDPNIQELIAVKGCPPRARDIVAALHRAGIPAPAETIEKMAFLPASAFRKYRDRPEFQEDFYRLP